MEKVEVEDGPPFLRLTRADADGIAAFEQQQRQAKVEEIMTASGGQTTLLPVHPWYITKLYLQ